MSQKRYTKFQRRTRCRWCRDGIEHIDYKNVGELRKMVDMQGKILPKRRSGNCTRHQRGVKTAVKHARFLGLLGQG